METLTYNSGLAPTVAIRERIAIADTWPPLFKLTAKGLDVELDAGDLLAVLDALAVAAGWDYSEVESDTRTFENVRSTILAALGIEEA